MLLKSIPKEFAKMLDKKLFKSSMYLDFSGEVAPLEIVIHPKKVVFSKDQLTEDNWLFNSKDDKLIKQMKSLQLTDSYLITLGK